jgi:hypothetical protein
MAGEGAHSIAIELDLVHPLLARRRLSTGWESWGGMNCGGTPRRDLTACETERLMTRTLNSNRPPRHAPHDEPFSNTSSTGSAKAATTRTRGCYRAPRCWRTESIVEQSERGRLSGGPFVRWPR